MSTRSGLIRPNRIELSPPRTRKGVSPPRSPARARKSSPPVRSSARKSPSRKSKSPSRKTASKYPARKSPSRTTKETTETAAQKSPGKRASIKSEASVKLQDVIKLETYRGTRSRRSEYSVKDISSGVRQNTMPVIDKLDIANGMELFDTSEVQTLRARKPVEEVAPRRSSRFREFVETVPDIRRSLSKSDSKSISKSVSKSISQSIDTYSDEENLEDDLPTESGAITRKLATPLRDSNLAQISSRWDFGGRVGSAILMVLLPLSIFTILISCSKTCSVKSLLDMSYYKSVSVWLSPVALSLVGCQYIIQALIAVVPILGTKGDRMDDTGSKYCFNAFFGSIFAIIILFTLNFFNIFNSNTLLSEYFRMAVVSYVFAVLLSIILYIKSRNMNDNELNPYGNTGYVMYDFCMGREIHPYIKKLDVKIWISRIANITALIFAVLIFKQSFHLRAEDVEKLSMENYMEFLSKVQLKPTILLYSMMQIVYLLNFIMKEYKITSTFYWQSEGMGYFQIVSSALYPYYFMTISKFVADTDLSLSTNALISASVLYMLGFFIMLLSNNIKHEFRRNPFHPSLARLDSMPTFHGKKLLVSSLWRIVRHPNYTGDILIHISLSLPGILSRQYMAAAPAVLTILLLVHRSWRDHARCKRRYGAAWERYCKRVPSVFFPKVL